MYEFGRWYEDLSSSRHYLSSRSPKDLPFDREPYPSKPKGGKIIKPLRSKSTKPRYSKGFDDSDSYYRRRSEGEE
jgi:hypothetical protein